MKEIVSFFSTIGLLGLAFIALHYLVLFLGLNDVFALILFALPICIFIAYSTHDQWQKIWRTALTIYGWVVGVVLATAGLALSID